ncbi:MAG: hypothetical protein FWC70_00310 [Defluviitaleaceae bacterium]|nr:hypothetical protein [Defluviitaleaceae bacterium]
MALENIKNTVHQNISELFASAAVDALTGDTEAHRTKLEIIAQIAELLGIETEITTVTINLKAEMAQK